MEILAGSEGDRFEAGARLVQLSIHDLLAQRQAAQAQLVSADAALRSAGVQLGQEIVSPQGGQGTGGKGMPNLMDQMFTNPMASLLGTRQPGVDRSAQVFARGTQVEQARQALSQAGSRLQGIEARTRDSKSMAPFAGVITSKPVEVGDMLGLRPAIVITLVIPVVILFAVFAAFLMGYTIDRVSLFALIFSIGILVDDAIVLVESIYRRWLLREQTDTPTAVDAARLGATLSVVEMPPGPPVLQTVVAEVYGPDGKTRREVAAKMTEIFRATEGMADVDDFMLKPDNVLRFEVDTQKAVRVGASVEAIVRNLAMAFGEARVGDVKGSSLLEPTFIVIQVPLAQRSDVERLADRPIPTNGARTLPLAELARFVLAPQDQPVHQKDLRPVESVVGDAVGRLGAPIYPMLRVQEALEGYTTPDGVRMSGHFTGPPPGNGRSGFEWAGEWTVTYETFRDMGIAFAAALLLIYLLVVSQFGNLLVPAIILAPIPLTLLGIVPGHWLMGAEFTATSMIGLIALAGIIVRNSILPVDFAIVEVGRGQSVREAVLGSCRARTRPILITAFALVGGSSVILTDPIFQGMAVSLLFGVLVSTLATLIVTPLGCISAGGRLIPPSPVDLEAPRGPAPAPEPDSPSSRGALP